MIELTQQRAATSRRGAAEISVALVGIAWIVLAAFWAAEGVLGVDSLIHLAMVDAFARDGSFVMENGFGAHRSPNLVLENVTVIGDRLVPQYPGGWAIAAAPAYLIGGIRGVILLNAVASALTLAMIYVAAEALFRDRRVAVSAALIHALGTFAIDYAFGVWPHAVATFLVTAGFAAAARGWRGSERDELRGFLVAGVVLGLAVNVRVDAIFAVAGIAAWMMAAARRPYAGLAMLVLGLAPGLVAATAINYAKFGLLSPITYGKSGGGASFSTYAPYLPAVAAVGLACLALGLRRVRSVARRPAVLVAVFVGMAALIVLVPALRAVSLRIAEGFYVLVVDFQAHAFPGRGLIMAEDGTILSYGLAKKALLQSLPYAAVVIVLLPRLIRGPDRAALGLCVLFALPFILFFSATTWHGAGFNNMRYFLHIVPPLAILSAVALRELVRTPDRRRAIALAAQFLFIGAVAAYAAWRGLSFGVFFQRVLPTVLTFAIAAAALLFLISRGRARGAAASSLEGLVLVGLVTAFISAWLFDVGVGQKERRISAETIELANRLPEDAVVMTRVTSRAGFRLNRPPAITANVDAGEGPFDAALLARVRADGRPVYAQGRELADAMVAAGAANEARAEFGVDERWEFYRLAPPADTGAVGN